VARIAEAAAEPDGARYAPQPGLPELRDAFADELNQAYSASLQPADVLITPGCNEAFCLAAAALVAPGDAVVVASPFYFNHDMWLRVEGVEVRRWDGAPQSLKSCLDDSGSRRRGGNPGKPDRRDRRAHCAADHSYALPRQRIGADSRRDVPQLPPHTGRTTCTPIPTGLTTWSPCTASRRNSRFPATGSVRSSATTHSSPRR
jgi:hypothetical protein